MRNMLKSGYVISVFIAMRLFELVNEDDGGGPADDPAKTGGLTDLKKAHKRITDHPQSGWFDEAPSKGAKIQTNEHRTSNFEF